MLERVQLAGASQVGKTSFILAANKEPLPTGYIPSIGPAPKTISIAGDILQLFDISDTTITLSEISKKYIVCLFDLTNKETFDKLDEFFIASEENTPIAIIGTKADLTEERAVDKTAAKTYAEAKKVLYFEVANNATDATAEIHPHYICTQLLNSLKASIPPQTASENESPQASNAEQQKKSSCAIL